MAGVVVIGGGHAAGQLAATLRQNGYSDAIDIVSDEAHVPYQRPPLSKQFLAGEWEADKLLLRPESFYDQRTIAVHRSTRATAIDRTAQRVQLAESHALDYEHLVIATGSRARKLTIAGSDARGIFYLRALDDVVAIRAAMASAKRVVIVGGGYIGLEVAAIAVQGGKQVDVLEMESRILQRVTTPFMSAFYAEVHAEHGVRIHTSRRVSEFTHSGGQVTGVACEDGQHFPAEVVIVGVGVIPNVELAQAIGLEVDNGIAVDEHCRTSAPNIYAIGDCARGMNLSLGRRIRLESVPNAMEQARVAALTICGKPAAYESMPWFWSDQYDLKLQMVGFAADGDVELRRGDPKRRQFITVYLKDGIVRAADSINTPREFLLCRQMAEKRTRLDTARFVDLAVDFKTLLD